MDLRQHVAAMNEQGYTLLSGFFSPGECGRMSSLFDSHVAKVKMPVQENGGFGIAIHPLLPAIPELATFMDRPELAEVLGAVLQDEPHLVHLGARISDGQSAHRIGWHHHYGWDVANLLSRKKVERVLFGVYVNGTMQEVGPLLAKPRKFDDPIGECKANKEGIWEGEQFVESPPGSVVIFDTALWHSAQRGTKAGPRILWGAHVQGWSDLRPHGEDNLVNGPEMDSYKTKCKNFAKLIG